MHQMPISESAQCDLLRLFNVGAGQFADAAVTGDLSFLNKISYKDFLDRHLGIRSPEEPTVIHMERAPIQPDTGLTPREQYRAGRQELLSLPFESIERSIRMQLAGMLGDAGFDAAFDIEAITMSRWPHGYAYHYSPLFDPEFAEEEYPHVRGRRPVGRVAIANSDSGARAYLDCAIDRAYRAVEELSD